MRVSQDVAAQIGSHRANGGTKSNGTMKAVVRPPGKKMAKAGSGTKNNDDFNAACCLPVLERNKRSVWTVPTQGYSEAHFATYPEKLIEPCILAGSQGGGMVLDPFGGSGTTAVVALRHGRRAVLCELNPEYAAMARRRIEKSVRPHTARDERAIDSPLFMEAAP
jgi:DNA modification methylase